MAKRDSRKGTRWSYTAGHYPYSVRVYERTPGGILYSAVHDPRKRDGRGGEKRKSLGHRDKEAAKDYADDQAKKLRKGTDNLLASKPTARRILAAYTAHRTPDKGEAKRQEDERQSVLWKTFLGPDFDLSRLSRREWDTFIRLRRSGAIDARGNRVTDPEERRSVKDRTIEKDLTYLRAVCRWAMEWRADSGRFLLDTDPTRGFKIPKEKNPERSVATHDRVDAIREHYRTPTMRVEWNGRQQDVESFLPEIFEIVVGTGRRIGAVCELRYEDLDLEKTPAAPRGAIIWPEDTDKVGKKWRCPISADVREALESALTKRQHVGPGPLFPMPTNRKKPISYHTVSQWLEDTESLANLQPQKRTLWHAYRRLWASARKDLPDVDVAQAGGWASLQALKSAYQQPDDATMLRVVEHAIELREVK